MHLLVKGIQHRVTGEVLVPNSKYHAHRALILASLADGESRIHGLTDARHVEYTVRLLRGLGVRITRDGDTFVVRGLGGRYRPPSPRTTKVSPSRVIRTPSPRSNRTVYSTCRASVSPWMRLSPSAREARIRARCAWYLEFGTRTSPVTRCWIPLTRRCMGLVAPRR